MVVGGKLGGKSVGLGMGDRRRRTGDDGDFAFETVAGWVVIFRRRGCHFVSVGFLLLECCGAGGRLCSGSYTKVQWMSWCSVTVKGNVM